MGEGRPHKLLIGRSREQEEIEVPLEMFFSGFDLGLGLYDY